MIQRCGVAIGSYAPRTSRSGVDRVSLDGGTAEAEGLEGLDAPCCFSPTLQVLWRRFSLLRQHGRPSVTRMVAHIKGRSRPIHALAFHHHSFHTQSAPPLHIPAPHLCAASHTLKMLANTVLALTYVSLLPAALAMPTGNYAQARVDLRLGPLADALDLTPVSDLLKDSPLSGALPGSASTAESPLIGVLANSPVAGLIANSPNSGALASTPVGGLLANNPLSGVLADTPVGGLLGTNSPLSSVTGKRQLLSLDLCLILGVCSHYYSHSIRWSADPSFLLGRILRHGLWRLAAFPRPSPTGYCWSLCWRKDPSRSSVTIPLTYSS